MEPTESAALYALQRWSASRVVSLERFPTGNQHYVYDVVFEDGAKAVLRLTRPEARGAMVGALRWNRTLRPLGVPLPEILFADLEAELPFLILERLPGTDLGTVIDGLSEAEQREIAAQVIAMQRIVQAIPSAGRFGYGVSAERASHASWMDCLRASVARSRGRIQRAGLIKLAWVDRVARAWEKGAPELCQISPTPFLHDLTTKNVIISQGRLSGIVDVDDLCFGDPLFQIALTKMALLSQGSSLSYIDYLLALYGEYSRENLDLYTALFALDFLSELGRLPNGNPVDSTPQRIAHLEAVLASLC